MTISKVNFNALNFDIEVDIENFNLGQKERSI